MKNRLFWPMVGGFALGLLVASAVFAAPSVHAEDASDYDPRVGHLYWTDGKAHPQLDLAPEDRDFRWLAFVRPDANGFQTTSLRKGPEQGKVEFIRTEVCRNTYRTVVFLIAYDEDYGRPYVVVPGFKIKDPAVNEQGIPIMPVVRIEQKDHRAVLAALRNTLASRGLENAPVNFWF